MDDLIFAADHGQLSFRWIHFLAGVVWIGILYFFNWINGPFAATLDAESKRKVVPELMPRALWWFRWGAAWTWITGVALLFVMYYIRDTQNFFSGETLLEFAKDERTELKPSAAEWGIPFAALFVGFIIYDNLFKIVGSKGAQAHAACVVIWGLIATGFFWFLTEKQGMSGRAGMVHVGGLFGTAMAANVWMRIWPAQQRIITAIKNGEAPDAADPALAGLRSKHNTYMSVPLLLLMVSVDQTKITGGICPMNLAIILAVSWAVTYGLYKKSTQVKGF